MATIIEPVILFLSLVPSHIYVLLLYISRSFSPFTLLRVSKALARRVAALARSSSALPLEESIFVNIQTFFDAEQLLAIDSHIRVCTAIFSVIQLRFAIRFLQTSAVSKAIARIESLSWNVLNTQIGSSTIDFPSRSYGICMSIARGMFVICAALITIPLSLLPISMLSFLLRSPIKFLCLVLYSRSHSPPGARPHTRTRWRNVMLNNYLHGLREQASYTEDLYRTPTTYIGKPSIRLVILMPGYFSDRLECKLFTTVWVSPGPSYEALSYVWGDTTLCEEISVNGRRFMITKNLRLALVYLRRLKRPRMLWIDALSINQACDEDRTTQVQQMRDIYSHASNVIVWLGLAPFGTDRAFDLLGLQSSIREQTPLSPALGKVLIKLLSTAWWTRIWVVQEVIDTKLIVVQSGDHTIFWEDFSRLIKKLRRTLLRSGETHGIKEFDALQRQRELRSHSSDPKNLVSLVFDFRNRGATDPRDKIFALLGLERFDENYQDSFPLVRVNYSKSPLLIAQEFIVGYILRYGSLASLAMTEGRKQSVDFFENDSNGVVCHPIWSGKSSAHVPEPFWKGDLGPKSTRKRWQRSFSAAGGIRAESRISYNLAFYSDPIEVLVLRGFVYDVVRAVSFGSESSIRDLDRPALDARTLTTYFHSKLDWRIIFRAWLDFAKRQSNYGDDDFECAFHRTLTAGLWETGMLSADRADYLTVRDEVCKGRNFFVTKKNSWFGLGPGDVKPGHLVCVLFGCDVPIILRRSFRRDLENFVTDKYIGQAYVHEIMQYQGDMRQDIANGRRHLQDFRLKIVAANLDEVNSYLFGSRS